MTLREHLINNPDEILARLLIKERTYEVENANWEDIPTRTITEYITTDGDILSDVYYSYDDVLNHQMELLNSEYEIKSIGE